MVEGRVARPALRYHGGKWRLAPWVIANLPAHECYVEPFGGGGSVLLRKEPSALEIYNDLDSEVVNFFRVLRDRTEALVRAVSLTPYSREEQWGAYVSCEDDLERARRFFVAAWQSFGATISRRSGWRFMRVRGARGSTPIDDWSNEERLFAVAKRLRGVGIEHGPADEVIRRFDGPETLFYCDPPYTHGSRSARHQNSYVHEMDDDEHRALAATLHAVAGQVVLSGFASPLYEDLYGDWTRIERSSLMNVIGAVKTRSTECLWLSRAHPADHTLNADLMSTRPADGPTLDGGDDRTGARVEGQEDAQ